MASIADVVRGWFTRTAPTVGASSTALAVPEERSARVSSAGGRVGDSQYGVLEPRRGARTLRAFSEQNPWVRIAINHRKRAVTKAKYAIVRVDDDKEQPDERIVKKCMELFNFVNDKRTNLSWLLSMITEDILVMDAGVMEKELTFGKEIVALWEIDGSEIAPDPRWDGSEPNRPRYFQYRDGKLIAAYKNDELVYMMQNPRSNSAVGFSPMEALFDTIEADLYGAKMEFRLMKETAPAGFMYLGAGVTPESVQAFRDQWENDIAAARKIAFFGGGDDMDAKGGAPEFIPLRGSAREEERRAYIKWLVTKIAACFEIDLLVFNLSETITKSVGNTVQTKTDQGLLALGDTIESFITREIIWMIDPSHKHGFKFMDLTPRDVDAELNRMQKLMTMGATTPNEVRAELGRDAMPGSENDPEHWANLPYPFQDNTQLDPEEDVYGPDGQPAAGTSTEDDPDGQPAAGTSTEDDPDDKPKPKKKPKAKPKK
jgi:hypothetical protein